MQIHEIKNLEKVAERILEAIKNEEKIVLYGDTDLDGTTSVIILKETIKSLNGKILAIYFPDREIEGYGISEQGLEYLKSFSPGLLVTVDCGISNFREVKRAKELGFEVMVIDHHEILDRLPEASIIVDPKQEGDEYPFKGLATVGIVFKLSEVLLKDRMSASLRKSFLELVAIATIADMMPQEDDNKVFISEGLRSLEQSYRPGIKAFFEVDFLKNYSFLEKISKIISILNIRDVENNLPASFRLFTSSSIEQARKIIAQLIEKIEIRREKTKRIIDEISERISEDKDPIILQGNDDWDVNLISSVASYFCQKIQKPTFIFKKLSKESQGTVRVPSGIDSVALMKKCQQHLISFGGHPQASGFRIKNENLEEFKKCLIKNLCPVREFRQGFSERKT